MTEHGDSGQGNDKHLDLRAAIQMAGKPFRDSLQNKTAKYVAGEFMELNIEYVQNRQGDNETIGAESILKTGFTANQKQFLEDIENTYKELELFKAQVKQFCSQCNYTYCGKHCALWSLKCWNRQNK